MKKLLIALAFASTQVMAVGDVYEQGVSTPKTLNCTPPTTRAVNADGVEVPLDPANPDDNITTIVTTKNVTTNITEVVNADAECTRVYDFDAMSTGQYEVNVEAVDESIFQRTSVASETLYFLVQPQTMPPNAPTGLQLQ
jgi:hypothetical protein